MVVSNNPLALKLLSQPPSQAPPPAAGAPPGKVVIPALPGRGTKRPGAPTLPEHVLPSKIAMVRQELENDRRAVVRVHDKHEPFRSWLDVCQKLTRYHICTEMEIPEPILYHDDVRFEEEATTLLSKSRMLMNQFRRSLLNASMKDPMSCERHMMERMFIEGEKEQLQKDKDLATRYPELFTPTPNLKKPKSEPRSPASDVTDDETTDVAWGTKTALHAVAMETNDVIDLDTDEEDTKDIPALRINPPSDDLNTNIKLSPVSPASPHNFNIPSLDWAPSPSEQKAPLKLVLRKSATGFQNLTSPAPIADSDDSETENESSQQNESERESESLADNGESDEEEDASESVLQEESASTEVEASPTRDSTNKEFSSEYTRQISQGFEEISDDDDDDTGSQENRDNAENGREYNNGHLFEEPGDDFIGGDFYDFQEGAEYLDLGDQMQNAIDSILSLQTPTDQNGIGIRPQSGSRMRLNAPSASGDDLDAAVQSILF